MRRLGVLTGLAAERRIIERAAFGAGHAFACAAADPARAEREAAALIAGGAQALLSFGIAAGLEPAARPGGVICADHVILGDGQTLATDREWGDALAAAAAAASIAVARGGLAAADRALVSPADKLALATRTGARAADMESGPAARVAAGADIPYLAVRVIADPAERSLPEWSRAAILADGRIAILRVAANLAFQPWRLPALLGLARDTAAGFAGLRRVAGLAALLVVP